MDRPEPATGWPDRPLSAAEATALLDDVTDATGVWVMSHDDGVRSVVVSGDAPDDAVVDVVVETAAAFEMYSFSGGEWMDYGTQAKDDEDAPSMAGTLESYDLLAGDTDTDVEC
jgi:hypothetical protein